MNKIFIIGLMSFLLIGCKEQSCQKGFHKECETICMAANNVPIPIQNCSCVKISNDTS
jgi:hypothetical protein